VKKTNWEFICQGSFNPDILKESLGLRYAETVRGNHNYEYCYIKVQQKRAEHIEKVFLDYDNDVPDSRRIKLTNLPGEPKLVGFGAGQAYKRHAIYKEIQKLKQQGCSSYKIWQDQESASEGNDNANITTWVEDTGNESTNSSDAYQTSSSICVGNSGIFDIFIHSCDNV